MTQPGLSSYEGVFLITATDDGADAIYFIAHNARHSILRGDLQLERQLNPLWPVRLVERDVVLGFPEGAPVGAARLGLLSPAVAEDTAVATDVAGAAAEAVDPGDAVDP